MRHVFAGFAALICALPGSVHAVDPDCIRGRLAEVIARIETRYHNPVRYTVELRNIHPLLVAEGHYDTVHFDIRPGDDLEGIALALSRGLVGSTPEHIHGLLRSSTGRLKLNDLLRDDIRRRAGRFDVCNGPNCWNATLNWNRPGFGYRYSSEEEIVKFLGHDYVQLPASEPIRFGDAIAVWDGSRIVHTAVALSGNLVWHKSGLHSGRPYSFQTVQQMLRRYYPEQSPSARVTVHRFLPAEERGASATGWMELRDQFREGTSRQRSREIPREEIEPTSIEEFLKTGWGPIFVEEGVVDELPTPGAPVRGAAPQ